jgi:Domain of unknown function (DUF5615)
MKLLIDECLSRELVKLARKRGHHEASHIVWIGKQGWKDWDLIDVIVEDSWTFVTRNSIDFRGPRDAPGSKGYYASLNVHPGLVCLNSLAGMDLELQIEPFTVALDEIDRDDDLVNQGMEITLQEPDREIEVRRYAMPVN